MGDNVLEHIEFEIDPMNPPPPSLLSALEDGIRRIAENKYVEKMKGLSESESEFDLLSIDFKTFARASVRVNRFLIYAEAAAVALMAMLYLGQEICLCDEQLGRGNSRSPLVRL